MNKSETHDSAKRVTTQDSVKQATNDFMSEIERKSDFPAIYILTPLILSSVLVYFGYLELHVTNVISIVYAVYWTVKSLEHKEEDDDKQWYTYWLIWGYFFLLDALFPNLMRMIPLFYFSKLLFFSWMFLPPTKGALYLYKKVFSKIPYDFNKLIQLTDNFRARINKKIDQIFGINLGKTEDLQESRDFPKEGEDFSRGRENLNTESSEQESNQFSRRKDLDIDRGEEDQHESRQNIIGDAKINTDDLKTNLQNVRDKFSNTVERFKELRENIGSSTSDSGFKENENWRENEMEREKESEKMNENVRSRSGFATDPKEKKVL